MYPQDLVREFWSVVLRLLVEQHRVPHAEAKRWIAESRQWWRSHAGANEGVVYNGGPERAADAIATAIERGGFPEPQPMRPEERRSQGIA